MTDLIDPALDPKNDRRTTFPIIFADLWKMKETHEATIWHTHAIDNFTQDLTDWKEKMNEAERTFVSNVLAFFASSDSLVAENLTKRFCNEVNITEAKYFYGIQIMMENIHAETYSKLLDVYIKDKEPKEKFLNAIETIPAIGKKARWVEKWMNSERSFAHRLLAFAIVEGIFFSGSFCCIFWLRERKLMLELARANDYIARDEGLHTDFACLLYTNYVKNKLKQSEFEELLKEAVEIETEFINDSLQSALIGMNKDLMKQYIEFVADRLAKQAGFKHIFNSKNPFAFMERSGLVTKANFFEATPTQYSKKVLIGDDIFDKI